MSNRYKTKNYKSAVQFYNSTSQPIVTTDILTSPVILSLGTRVTDTGIAIDFDNNGLDIEASGLYRVSANLDILGVTAGNVTFAMTLNGQILPETLRTVTAVAGISEIVPLETVRTINICCGTSDFNFSIIAFSDGTGEATVEQLSGNAIKLA